MKISFFTTWDTRCGIAGYSKALVDSLKYFAAIKIVPVEPRRNPLYYHALGREMNDAQVAHIQYEYRLFNIIKPYCNNFSIFINQIKIPRVVTLHSLLAPLELKPLTASFMKNIKVIVRNKLYSQFIDSWQKDFFEKFDYLIVHTKQNYQKLRELGIEERRILNILHPISRPLFVFDKDLCKREYGVQDNIVLTLFGFVNRIKGYESVLHILPQLPKDIVLLIAGYSQASTDIAYLEWLKSLIRERELMNRVKITGYLPEMGIGKVMAMTDICLAPFVKMDASGSLSQCIAYNKPIIASDLEPHKEINEEFDCLELFKVGDALDLSEKIKGLINNQLRCDYLVRGTKQYSERYNYERLAKEMIRIYDSLM